MSINFSIPNTPSLTKTTPDKGGSIFVPDIKYLIQFSKGDLGIADNITKSAILKTVNTSKSTKIASTYLKMAGGKTDDTNKYFKDGKVVIPESSLQLSSENNQAGLKALEKSLIQSIFDSQKPYMDMVSELSNILIFVEDIIARTLSLGGKSMKPKTNPRALGYKESGKTKTEEELSKLKSLSKSNNNSSQNNNGNIQNDKNWQIESIKYSTGDFNPNVNYTYEYIDVIENDLNLNGTASINTKSKYPKNIIIAVFDNEGNVINNIDDYNLLWLKTNKWFGNFQYLKTTNIDDINFYFNYFKEYAEENIPNELNQETKNSIINKVNDYNTEDDYKNVKDYISNLMNDCYLKSAKYTNESLLDATNNKGIKSKVNIDTNPFKPKKIKYNGSDIWINPESDYDLKMIRCDYIEKQNDNDINTNNLLSKDFYGVDDNDNESIGYINRNKNNDKINDKITINGVVVNHKTYFILEGVLSDENEQSYESKNSNGNNFSYYRKKSFFTAPSQFIKLIIQISSKLVPSINSIKDIGSDPIKFVTDIMKSNLGDNNKTKDIKFSFFSSDFVSKFNNIKNTENKKDFIKNSILKNYVVLNKDNTYRFLFSGTGMSILNNIKIKYNTDEKMITSTSSNILPYDKNNLDNNIKFNTLKFTSNESETIDYIGGYDPNKKYTYIYVDRYVLDLLKEGQDLEDSGDLLNALDKYNEAVKLDPNNPTLKDKIDNLKKVITTYGGNPLFGFILNMMTMPLQIVFGVIEEITNILKKFTNPAKLQDAIKDLVSFKIFPGGLTPTDFFTPKSMLKLANIEFNVDLFIKWVSSVKTLPIEEYDLNKIIKLPFVISFPKYSAKQFEALIFGKGNIPNLIPLKMLTSILKIFEGVVNAIISFFWALLGLSGLLDKPVLKFTKSSNDDLSAGDIMSILNGTYNDIINPNSTSNSDFIYKINLPDGRTINQLNRIELQEFITKNNNFIYEYKI
jgi:hypothetical protein